jgi:hypothetical protein
LRKASSFFGSLFHGIMENLIENGFGIFSERKTQFHNDRVEERCACSPKLLPVKCDLLFPEFIF